jgi:thiol-disulfide isomerase/thioredoxin
MLYTALMIELLASVVLGMSVQLDEPDTRHVLTHTLYRVEMMTPGGVLPFVIAREHTMRAGHMDEQPDDWYIINGEERIVRAGEVAISGYFGDGRDALARRDRRFWISYSIPFADYDSSLEWHTWMGFRPSDEPVRGEGVWRKRRGEAYAEIPVMVTTLDVRLEEASKHRFMPVWGKDADALEDEHFAGRWRVQFETSDEPAIGVFEVDEHQLATGTFQTTTGDYRFLEGRVDGPYLRLSTFDGAHAFLFHARMQEDGSLKGDFWSGNWHHETWTAVRDDNAILPDAFEQTMITDEQALADAVFKDFDGNPTRVLDALDETKAKARVLEIFGTWCPNCSDAGRELVSLKEKYGDDLGIVALAFEVTEDFERSSQQVQRHHAHIGSDWEILIAGLSDKAKATETLGFLDRVRSYPTLIFLNADNEVQAVYSGFSGPATGDAYTNQRERFEALIEQMINE